MSDPFNSWLPPSPATGAVGPAPGPSSPSPAFWPVPSSPVTRNYAPWGKRVTAALIDSAPGLVGAVLFTIGYVELIVRLLRSGSAPSLDDGATLMILGGAISLLALGWTVYNRWFGAGRGGQSLGKRTMKISLVSLQTGGPVGPANACVRDLVHIVDGLACVGYLWPLWDEKRQTFADKVMDTVVIDSPSPT